MRDNNSRGAAAGLLAFFWILIAAAAYYYNHKPVDLPLALQFMRMGFWFAAAFAVVFVSGGIGRAVLNLQSLRPAARAAVEAALGLGVLGLVELLLGSLAGVSAWLNCLVLLLLGWTLRRPAVRWLSGLADVAVIFRQSGNSGRMIALMCGVGTASVLTSALSPPIAFDSLVYHLALPQNYLASGRITFIEPNAFWGMPQLVEMLSTWVMALTGAPESAAILGWFAGVLALVGLLGYTTRKLGPQPGWVALAALLAGETTLRGLAWGYVDWWALLFGLCILVLLDDAFSAGKTDGRRVLTAGLLAGFALGTKYSAGAALLAGLAAILFARSGQLIFRERLRRALKFGAAASAAAAPWLLKNLLTVGNPAYPFIFPAGPMTDLRLDLYTGQPAWGGLENALLLPWQAAVTGVGGGPGFSASVGPLLLAFAGLAWIGWRDRPEVEKTAVSCAGVFAVTGLVVWAAAGRLSGLLIQTRLYFVLFPAFAFLAGAGFQGLSRVKWSGVRLGRIGTILLLLVLGLNILEVGRHLTLNRTLPYLLGQESRNDFLRHNLGMYQLAMEAVDALPEGSKPLLLFEPRGLACAPTCDPDEMLDRWVVDARAQGYDVDQIVADWRASGITHVLYYKFGAAQFFDDPRFMPEDWTALAVLEDSLQGGLDLNGVYILAELP